jgi:hypothetical protein
MCLCLCEDGVWVLDEFFGFVYKEEWRFMSFGLWVYVKNLN